MGSPFWQIVGPILDHAELLRETDLDGSADLLIELVNGAQQQSLGTGNLEEAKRNVIAIKNVFAAIDTTIKRRSMKKPQLVQAAKLLWSVVEGCNLQYHRSLFPNLLKIVWKVDPLYAFGRYQEQLAASSSMPPFVYQKVFEGLLDIDQFERASIVFNEMLTAGHRPDNQFLAVFCCKAGEAKAVDLVRAAHSLMTDPDRTAYHLLIRAYALNDLLDDVQLLLKEMSDRGIAADALTYFPILKAHATAGRLTEMETVLSTVEAAALDPTQLTPLYNAALSAYAHTGVVIKGYTTYRRMLRHNVAPDNATLRYLLLLYSRAYPIPSEFKYKGVFKPANLVKVFRVSHGVEMDAITIGVFLDALCVRSNGPLNLLPEFQDLHETPSSQLLLAAAKRHLVLDQFGSAKKYLLALLERGETVDSELLAETALGCLVKRNLDDARKLLHSAWNAQIRPNRLLFGIELAVFVLQHREDDARRRWVQMTRTGGAEPDMSTVTLLLRIALYIGQRNARWDTIRFIQSMSPALGSPDMIAAASAERCEIFEAMIARDNLGSLPASRLKRSREASAPSERLLVAPVQSDTSQVRRSRSRRYRPLGQKKPSEEAPMA